MFKSIHSVPKISIQIQNMNGLYVEISKKSDFQGQKKANFKFVLYHNNLLTKVE